MIFESTLVLSTILIILFFFYKQAVKEFRILQTDSLDKVLSLMNERSPIVVHPAPKTELWTEKDLKQRPQLKKQVEPYLKKISFFEPALGQEIATKVGFPVWVNQTILQPLKNMWWGSLLWSQTKVTIGPQGLRPTFGFCTIILATEGTLQVSLLNESSDPYLPKQWLGKRLSKLTRDDAPLLKQIQFVDIILRPGSALIVPPHWKVCWENKEKSTKIPTLGVWIDIHHPVSFVSQQAFYRKSKK
jgi:hypothetical protein